MFIFYPETARSAGAACCQCRGSAESEKQGAGGGNLPDSCQEETTERDDHQEGKATKRH